MEYSLSDREQEVLRLISLELTSKEIASALYLSRHTIETHKKNIKYKLQVRNIAGVVRKGFELGFLSFQPA